MDTNNRANTGVSALRVSSRAAAKITAIIVGFIAVAGFAAGVTGAGAALSTQADIVSVDRAHKGDRLSVAPKHSPTVSSPGVTTLSHPPIGCESAFSRVADPKRSHIFGRCVS
jgi:hypothetical protein